MQRPLRATQAALALAKHLRNAAPDMPAPDATALFPELFQNAAPQPAEAGTPNTDSPNVEVSQKLANDIQAALQSNQLAPKAQTPGEKMLEELLGTLSEPTPIEPQEYRSPQLSQDATVSPAPVVPELFQLRYGVAENAPGSAATPPASEPHYVLSFDGEGGLDHETTQAGVNNYLRRQNNGPPVQIVNDPTWTHNGYGIRGAFQDDKIIVNRAFIDSADTLQQVLREEHNHAVLSSPEGRTSIRYAAAGSSPGDPQYLSLSRQYPRQPGESAADWQARLMDEFIAKSASENLPLWKQIVERVKTWLAGKGIGSLSDQETARAIIRALKSGKTADEFAPRLLDIGRSNGPLDWWLNDDSALGDSAEENGQLISRYNLTKEPLQGMSVKQAEEALTQLFGTKQLPAAIRVFRDRAVSEATTIRPRGAIALNAAKVYTPEEAEQAILARGLREVWFQPKVQEAWQQVRSSVTGGEMTAASNRRQAQGLRTDFGTAQEEAAIARLINSDGHDSTVGDFHNAIRTALKHRFDLNLPAAARPLLKEAAIQFLRNRNGLSGVSTSNVAIVPKAAVSLGKWGEMRLDEILNGAGIKQPNPVKTSLTYRRHDQVVNKIAHESKGGIEVSLEGKIRTQIQKDAELIKTGKIRGAHWHFFQGAHPDTLKFLEQNGIGYTVYY